MLRNALKLTNESNTSENLLKQKTAVACPLLRLRSWRPEGAVKSILGLSCDSHAVCSSCHWNGAAWANHPCPFLCPSVVFHLAKASLFCSIILKLEAQCSSAMGASGVVALLLFRCELAAFWDRRWQFVRLRVSQHGCRHERKVGCGMAPGGMSQQQEVAASASRFQQPVVPPAAWAFLKRASVLPAPLLLSAQILMLNNLLAAGASGWISTV